MNLTPDPMQPCWHTHGVRLDNGTAYCKNCNSEIDDPELLEQILAEEAEKAAGEILAPWPPPFMREEDRSKEEAPIHEPVDELEEILRSAQLVLRQIQRRVEELEQLLRDARRLRTQQLLSDDDEPE